MWGQKKFNVTFVLPDSAHVQKMNFYYYDCIQRSYIPVSATYTNNTATISHSYNTVYAKIFIDYNFGERRPFMSIVTTEKPASITLVSPINEADPFNNATILNAHDWRQEISDMTAYIKEPQERYIQMYDSITPSWTPHDSLAFEKLEEANIAIENKRFEYIRKHSNSYYSFSLFETFSISTLSPDLLLRQFATIFPARFKNSEEGASIKNYLLNRAILEGKKKALSFTATDIDSNKIILNEIYKKKQVLLVFWGTWCKPCLDEIPLLRAIRKKYPTDQLEIIAIATQSPPEKVRQLIKEQQLDWTHIINNNSINLLYQVISYPEIYLIDTNGNVKYKKSSYPDINLENLNKTIEIGFHSIKK
jgi:thiol-disulfide isomerase/thioredoxin